MNTKGKKTEGNEKLLIVFLSLLFSIFYIHLYCMELGFLKKKSIKFYNLNSSLYISTMYCLCIQIAIWISYFKGVFKIKRDIILNFLPPVCLIIYPVYIHEFCTSNVYMKSVFKYTFRKLYLAIVPKTSMAQLKGIMPDIMFVPYILLDVKSV